MRWWVGSGLGWGSRPVPSSPVFKSSPPNKSVLSRHRPDLLGGLDSNRSKKTPPIIMMNNSSTTSSSEEDRPPRSSRLVPSVQSRPIIVLVVSRPIIVLIVSNMSHRDFQSRPVCPVPPVLSHFPSGPEQNGGRSKQSGGRSSGQKKG